MNEPAAGSIAQKWNAFWFAPGSPRNLAAARILFAVTSLWLVLSRNWYGTSGLPSEFWQFASARERWRYLDFPGHPLFEHSLQWIAVLTLLSALLGYWPRLSCFLSGILLYHLAPLESIIWTPSPYVRGATISVLALLTLSFAPCGDAWTLGNGHRRPTASLSDYTWPLRLIQLFLCQVYLFSGYAKIFHSSWHWASTTNMRNWLLYFSEQDQVRVFNTFGPWLAKRPSLCWAMGVGTLLFELGFISVLFSRRLRLLLVPAAVVFHLGIVLAMNLVFLNVPQLLVFADWDRIANWFAPSGEFVPSRKAETAVNTQRVTRSL